MHLNSRRHLLGDGDDSVGGFPGKLAFLSVGCLSRAPMLRWADSRRARLSVHREAMRFPRPAVENTAQRNH